MSFGVSPQPVSNETLRNLDPSLSFALTVQTHQELLLHTSSSSLSGLLQALDQGQAYAESIRHLQTLVSSLREAMELSATRKFSPGTAQDVTAHREAVFSDLTRWMNNAGAGVSSWSSSANALSFVGTGSSLKSEFLSELNLFNSALQQARNGSFASVDSSASRLSNLLGRINSEHAAVQTLRSNALSKYNGDQTADNWADYQKWDRELTAVNSLRSLAQTASQRALDTKTQLNGPTGILYSKTPTVQNLTEDFSLATWQDAGVITLTGPNGVGLKITSEGLVSSLGRDDREWDFNGKTTFVFSEGLKLTVEPASPPNAAKVQAIFGNEILTITPLQRGQTAGSTLASGGRSIDQNNKDGQVVTFASDSKYWMFGNNKLGDQATREVLASGQDVEVPVCAVDIAIPEELVSYFTSLGIQIPDLDNDGRFNEVELMEVNLILNAVIEMYQKLHSDAMSRVREATNALQALTQFMDGVQSQQHDADHDDLQLKAEDQETLRLIEARLDRAMQALKTGELSPNAIGQLAMAYRSGNAPASVESPVTPTSGETQPSASAFSRASRLLGTSSQALEMLQQWTAPTASSASLAGLGAWLGNNSLSKDGIASGLQGLVQDALDRGVSPEVFASLQSLLQHVQGLSDPLELGLSAGVRGDLESLGFSSREIDALTSLLAKVELSVGVDGKVPAMLSELGLAQLTSAMLALPAPVRDALKSAFLGVADQLNTWSASELGGALSSGSLSEAWKPLSDAIGGLSLSGGSGAAALQSAFFANVPVGGSISWLQQLSSGTASANAIPSWISLGNSGGTQPGLGLLGWAGAAGKESLEQANQSSARAIAGNFMTPAELLKRFEANLNMASEFFKIQMREAEQLFVQAQGHVEKFFEVLKRENLGQEVIQDDNLSDDMHDAFKVRMNEFRKDMGLEWGNSETAGNSEQESRRVNRMMQSGMMV